MPQAICFAESIIISEKIAKHLSGNNYTTKFFQDNPSNHIFFHFKRETHDIVFDFIITFVPSNLYKLDFNKDENSSLIMKISTSPQLIIDENFQLMFEEIINKSEQIFLFMNPSYFSEKQLFGIAQICSLINPNVNINTCLFSDLSFESITKSIENSQRLDSHYASAILFKSAQYFKISNIISSIQQTLLEPYINDQLNFDPNIFLILSIVYSEMYKYQLYKVEQKFTLTPILQNGQKLKWNRGFLYCKLSTFAFFRSTFQEETICQQAKLISISTKNSLIQKPSGLNTYELIRKSYRHLHYSPTETITTASELFELGLISSPFTEFSTFPSDFDFQRLLSILSLDPKLLSIIVKVRQQYEIPQIDNFFHQEVPIYPISIPISPLNERQLKLFYFIVISFLASCCQNATIVTTVYEFDVGGELFFYENPQCKNSGFTEIYQYGEKIQNTVLSDYGPNISWKINDVISLSQFNMETQDTDPPKLLTPSHLFKLISESGICDGREALYYVQHLISQNLIAFSPEVSGDEYRPTPLGAALFLAYHSLGQFWQYLNEFHQAINTAVENIISGNWTISTAEFKFRNRDQQALQFLSQNLSVIQNALSSIVKKS